jgi:hypothetical protein
LFALLLLSTVLFFAGLSPVRGQDDLNSGSACSHISGGCPTFAHSGGGSSGSSLFTCDDDCQQRRAAERKEKEEADQRRREAKFDEKMQRDHAKAQQLAGEAFTLLQKNDCKKSIELYDKALTLWEGPAGNNFKDPWVWNQNMGAALACFAENLPANSAEHYKYDKFSYDYYLKAIDDVQADPGEVKRMKWAMWRLEYEHGRRCPEPPAWNGDGRGCVGRTDMRHDIAPYVPMPVVTAKTWTPRNLFISTHGKFSTAWEDIVTPDYSPTYPTSKPILSGEMKTDENTVVRLTLPDGHDLVFGNDTDLKLEDYTYDPNTSTTATAIEKLDGAIRFVSGKWQQFKDQQIRVRIPQVKQLHGTLAVRGTDVEILHFEDSKGDYPASLKGDWVIYPHDGDVEFLQHDDGLPADISDITRNLTPNSCGSPVCALIIEPDGETRFVTTHGHANQYVEGTEDWPMWVGNDREYR